MINEPQKPSTARSPDRSQEHHFQHDPDKTELERVLNKGLEKIEPYSNQILLGFLVVTVIAVAAIFMIRGTRASQSEGWKRFVACRVPDDFAELADAYPNTELGAWARLQQARGQLREGLQTALTNRSASDDNLNSAKEAFQLLLNKGENVPPQVREEALYGLATALEALSDGDTQAAIQAYEELINAYPESPHRLWAEQRIEELKKGSSQEFYAWFRTQKPAPADRPLPRDFSSSLDSQLDLELPELNLPAGTGNTGTAPATETSGTELSEEPTPPAPSQPEPIENEPAKTSPPNEPAKTTPSDEPATDKP